MHLAKSFALLIPATMLRVGWMGLEKHMSSLRKTWCEVDHHLEDQDLWRKFLLESSFENKDWAEAVVESVDVPENAGGRGACKVCRFV